MTWGHKMECNMHKGAGQCQALSGTQYWELMENVFRERMFIRVYKQLVRKTEELRLEE